MKIIKRLSDNVVLFAGGDLVLDQDGCRGPGWQSRNIDRASLILETVDDIPQQFIGGGWTYVDGAWESNSVGQDHIEQVRKSEVPVAVTRRQLRLALLQIGMLVTADEFVATQSNAVQVYWKDSQEFYRQHPLITGLSAEFGLTETQVDDIFIAASKA
ncbi:MAG: hypothetical protein K2Q14_06990 [Gammaproteobacteria bacterium]|nr:hypothetical protein [Nitrosomonas sp.]MBY0545273.1 hypothetical protein [Gammaproteobacteria bacterium]